MENETNIEEKVTENQVQENISAGQENSEAKEKADNKNGKKKKSKGKKVLRVILIFFLCIFLLLGGWVLFSALNKKSIFEVLPKGYSILIHTDSVWDAGMPLVDLEAADLFFTEQEFSSLRGPFMDFRASDARRSKMVSWLADRKAYVAVYPDGKDNFSYLAIVDMSYLSAVTRIASPFVSMLGIEDFSYNKETGFYEYGAKEDENKIYIKIIKNLVLISADYDLLCKASYSNNDNYTSEEKRLITSKTKNKINVLIDSKRFADAALSGNEVLKHLTRIVSENEFTELSLFIDNDTIKLDAKLPIDKENTGSEELTALLERKAEEPELLGKLTENVQYYTLINTGSFEELKDVAFSYIPKRDNAERAWEKGNQLSSAVFGLTIEEMIFSWTGSEYAVLGIENRNDPVFVFKVEDEVQREKIFNEFISSIIIKEDSSLILDGVRLSQLMLPDFIQSIIALFDLEIPRPYYMVKDGYIYFSESPETLASICGAAKKKLFLKKSDIYKSVIGNSSYESTIDLYYNLERSIPFFLRSNAALSKIIQLYSNGRFTLRLEDEYLEIELSAISKHLLDNHCIPGFPKNLEGKTDGILNQSGSCIFWLEKESNIRLMEVPSTKMYSFDMDETGYIAAGDTSINKNGCVWAITKSGKVYLLNNKLQVMDNFPVDIYEAVNEVPAGPMTAMKGKIVIPGKNGSLVFVDEDGDITVRNDLELSGAINSAPAVLDNIVAVYDKSFVGNIIILHGEKGEVEKIPVSGIGFESPALMKKGKDLYVGFLTQNGMLNIWKNGKEIEGFPKKLDSVFFKNVKTDGKYFYALSYGAVLYRIDVTGEILSVAIPYGSAKNGFISCGDEIYVTPDSNTMYAFDENLELVYGYPLLGWGKPVFADINGDNEEDCFVLSIDKKLYAWNLQ